MEPIKIIRGSRVHPDGMRVFGHADSCARWNLRDECSCGKHGPLRRWWTRFRMRGSA